VASGTATVHLKAGGFVRGELIEVQPGKMVRIKLADDTVRELPWAEVDYVDDPTLPPVAPRATNAGSVAAPSASGALLLTPAQANADEIRRLRIERDEISNTGPALMMVLGTGAFLFVGLPGVNMLSEDGSCVDDPSGDVYGDDEDDCDERRAVGAVMTVVGAIGGGIAIWGLIKNSHNREKRRALNNRILELKGERAGLTFGVTPRKNGASLALTLRM
jgi:hypothetical protein